MLKSNRFSLRGFWNRYPKIIWIINFISILNSAAISMSLPFLALYLFEKRGVPMWLVGVIILAGGIASGVTQLLGGVLTDKFGRRPLLLITSIFGIFFFAGMAFLIGYNAPVITVGGSYALVRCIMSIQRPIISAVVADITPPQRLTETFSFLRIGDNLGFAAGPALGGYLALFVSYAWLFGVAALSCVLALIMTFAYFKETLIRVSEPVNINSILSAGKDRSLLVFTILSLLIFLVMGQMASTLSVYTVSNVGFTTAQYGSLLTLNGLLVVVLQYPVTRLLGNRARLSLVVGSLLYVFGYLAMTWVGPYGLAILAMIVITFGEISFTPTSSALVGMMAKSAWRGRYMAFYGMSSTLGWSIGPLIGGVLLDLFPQQPLFIWGPIALVALIAAIGFARFKVNTSMS